jgi:2-aminoethylphosphonate-pyruvate transaminase
MPWADSAATVRAWATERAIELWVAWEDDLGPLGSEVVDALGEARDDGARLALLEADGAGDAGPSLFAVFDAMEANGVDDVRRVGVLGASAGALEAGQRSGAGAIVGVVANGDRQARRDLVPAQPDVIVDIRDLEALDRERYGSARPHRERLLLNPGPSVVSDRVHRAIAGPDLCHREPEYPALFGRVREKLLEVAGVPDDWAVVLLGGSGTAALEAMTGALVRQGRALLVCRNGVYGDRIATIAGRLGIRVVSVSASHTTPIAPGTVAAALDADPAIDAVALVHHETTTGLLNPVHEIAAITNARGIPLVADAISAFGSEELRLDGSGIDIVASTSNKNLHGLPGVAILIVSPRAQLRAREVTARSLYFDLPNYLDAQARSTVPFTPPVPATYALEAALDELLDEGVEQRRARYRARMDFLDRELERLGLVPVVARADRSSCVRSLPLPDGLTYEALHDAVRRDGHVIYAGLGEAAPTRFRICVLGAVEIDALRGFVGSLERALAGDRLPAGRHATSPT